MKHGNIIVLIIFALVLSSLACNFGFGRRSTPESSAQLTAEAAAANNQLGSGSGDGSGDCIEDWVCSEWSECTEGIQTRACTDQNECDAGEDPGEAALETRICEPEEPEGDGSEGGPPTGLFLDPSSWLGLLLLLIVLIIGAGAYMLSRKGRSKGKKK